MSTVSHETREDAVANLQAEVENLERELADADLRIVELEDQLSESYSWDHMQNEIQEAVAQAREEATDGLKPLAEDAHRLLGDLAWRAVNGDAAAVATEQQAGEILAALAEFA